MDRKQMAALVLSAAALVGIAGHESYRERAYIPVKGDVPTIGYGETAGVRMGQKTTPERALVQLLASVNAHADEIKPCITVPLSDGEWSAMVSLAYNIGSGAFCRSTLVKKLNASDYAGACAEILKWNRASGRVLPGLTKRRRAEYKTCIGE